MSLLTFPGRGSTSNLTDERLRTLLAAQIAFQIALDSAYADLKAGARYIGTSLRLSEDGRGVVRESVASCRSKYF